MAEPKMTKSEFYKIWYSKRLPDQKLNEYGYPNVVFLGESITTEEQWQKFLENEIDVEELVKLSKEASEILGVEYVKSYLDLRIYPQIGDQLDGIYKALLSIKNSGIDIGDAGNAYLDSITAVKEKFPKN